MKSKRQIRCGKEENITNNRQAAKGHMDCRKCSALSFPVAMGQKVEGNYYTNYLRGESGKCLVVTYLPTYSAVYSFTHFINICNYGTRDTEVRNVSPIAPHTLLILFCFLVSKVLFVDSSKACLGEFPVKDGRLWMSSKHTGSQMEENPLWSLCSYCCVLGNEITSHLYSLSPIPSFLPSSLPLSSLPYFILFFLSVLETKPRTLHVLGKCFSTVIQSWSIPH